MECFCNTEGWPGICIPCIWDCNTRLEFLGACLRDAGALCASFARGEYLERGKWDGLTAEPWSPGCGKSFGEHVNPRKAR
jgi:hypothetical protein